MTEQADFPNLLVVIGASAGGLTPIRRIITQLPKTFEAVIVVATHRDPGTSGNALADILEDDSRITVREPVEGELLNCTTLYVGGPAESVRIDGREVTIDEVSSHLERLQRIDDLFLSAARHARDNTIGIILSGTLWDGVEGLKAIHEAGGKCIVQDPDEAAFGDMPRNALEAVDVDFVGTTDEIASLLVELAADRNCR